MLFGFNLWYNLLTQVTYYETVSVLFVISSMGQKRGKIKTEVPESLVHSFAIRVCCT